MFSLTKFENAVLRDLGTYISVVADSPPKESGVAQHIKYPPSIDLIAYNHTKILHFNALIFINSFALLNSIRAFPTSK